jgi:hypothetical protein
LTGPAVMQVLQTEWTTMATSSHRPDGMNPRLSLLAGHGLDDQRQALATDDPHQVVNRSA